MQRRSWRFVYSIQRGRKEKVLWGPMALSRKEKPVSARGPPKAPTVFNVFCKGKPTKERGGQGMGNVGSASGGQQMSRQQRKVLSSGENAALVRGRKKTPKGCHFETKTTKMSLLAEKRADGAEEPAGGNWREIRVSEKEYTTTRRRKGYKRNLYKGWAERRAIP